MPSRKILTVLIICIATITSTWILLRIPKNTSSGIQNSESVTVSSYRNITATTSDDWKKVIIDFNEKNQNVTTNTNLPEVITLTSALAKDIFARALMMAKGGGAPNEENMNKMMQSILSSPEYLKNGGALYIVSNLHVTDKNDKFTEAKYKETFEKSLYERMKQAEGKDDPMAILVRASEENNEKIIMEMDPIIKANKDFINDLLNMEVPISVVKIHLDILNAASDILANIEDLRLTFEDPVRSLRGLSQYTQHLDNFTTSLQNMISYFEKN
ncbi:MAG: hypothetical protein WAX85_01810 [Minisyncoccia bacterium]